MSAARRPARRSARPLPLAALLRDAHACTLCAEHLPHGPRPILVVNAAARLLIIGQAPGKRVHQSGVPWDDPSGDRLRDWLGLDRERFYDERRVALMPMGFCYPGTGASGDLPPRPECAPKWHPPLLAAMPRVTLVVLLSQYAQAAYLGERCKATLTETVRAWREYDRFLPLPHPSPRNNLWLAKNPWFPKQVLPDLRKRVAKTIAAK